MQLHAVLCHGLAPARLCQQQLLVDLWAGLPYNGSLPIYCDTDVLDIMVVKDFFLLVYVTARLAQSSDT